MFNFNEKFCYGLYRRVIGCVFDLTGGPKNELRSGTSPRRVDRQFLGVERV
jgi:hypothetical protein